MKNKKKETGLSIDPELLREAGEVFEAVGLDLTSAVRMFLRQAVAKRRLPLDVGVGPSVGDERAPGPRHVGRHRGCLAFGRESPEGFVVLAGSRIVPRGGETRSCPASARRDRDRHASLVGADGVLSADIPFRTKSGAACFACGSSISGAAFWKKEEVK